MIKKLVNLINYYKVKRHNLYKELDFFYEIPPKKISEVENYDFKLKIIKEIINFNKQCNIFYENLKINKELKIGGTWKNYMLKVKKEQINAFLKNDANELILLYESMFYNCLIKGFLPYSYFEDIKFNNSAILNFLKDLDVYKVLFKNFDKLPMKNGIKKWGYQQKNNKIHFGALKSIIEKDLILNSHKLLNNRKKINILEIGSGYGALAERLFEDDKVNSLILTDIPSSLTTAYYYLSSLYGLDKVKIFSSVEGIKKHFKLDEKKILLIPTCYYDQIKNFQNVELLCNFSSFSEMDFDTIKYYLNNLPNEIKLIVSSNNNDETFRQDHHEVIMDRLPIPTEFDLVFSSIRMPFFVNWRYKTCIWFKKNNF